MSAETKYREGLEALERGNKACVSPRPRDAKLAAGTDLGTHAVQASVASWQGYQDLVQVEAGL